MPVKSNYPKVATDMFAIQMSWTLGFLGVMFIIHLVKIVISQFSGNNPDDFFVSTYFAAHIYMLVIGIIAGIGFPDYYVRNGVTSKDYFQGTAIASVGIAFVIPLLAEVVTAIETLIVRVTPITLEFRSLAGRNFFDFDDPNLIGDIVQMIIMSPYVDPSTNWLLALFIYGVNFLMCYLVGWLIGSGFNRFSVIGLMFIAIGIAFLLAHDIILGAGLGQSLTGTFIPLVSLPALNFSFLHAIGGVLALMAINLWIIRQTTKRLVIRI